MTPDLKELLVYMAQQNASDLHLKAFLPPIIRIDEKLILSSYPVLRPEDVQGLIYSILTKEQIERFEASWELDFSYELKDIARFRMNIFFQRNLMGASIRMIPFRIMSFSECGLPERVVTDLCRKPKGLVLVTGATGSGKSTTLASMIDFINRESPYHIITIEDPIEFVHENKKSVIDQREVGRDTRTFNDALKHVLRQDPDVILIGEMRDLETIETALIVAETGHLVLATLHTSDSVQTINRIIDVFPGHQQQQIRIQLSFVLSGIISQQLIPKASGSGRVLGTEVLLATSAVRSLIRDAKIHQIYSIIQTSQKEGMGTMNKSLSELYRSGMISYEEAMMRSTDTDDLMAHLKGS